MSTSLPAHATVNADERAWLLVVADGMGGHAAGEGASEAAIRTIIYFANELSSWVMRPTGRPQDDIAERARLYAEAIQQEFRLQSAFAPELTGMGTTLTGAYVMGDEAVIVNVGDSRTYLSCGDDLLQLTRDHTFAQELQDLGNPAESVAAFRHVLTRSFSTNNDAVKIDLCHVTLQPDDHLLLCSDGLSDMVSDSEIQSLICNSTSPKKGCESLVSSALDNGGRDNVTVILAKILDHKVC